MEQKLLHPSNSSKTLILLGIQSFSREFDHCTIFRDNDGWILFI